MQINFAYINSKSSCRQVILGKPTYHGALSGNFVVPSISSKIPRRSKLENN